MKTEELRSLSPSGFIQTAIIHWWQAKRSLEQHRASMPLELEAQWENLSTFPPSEKGECKQMSLSSGTTDSMEEIAPNPWESGGFWGRRGRKGVLQQRSVPRAADTLSSIINTTRPWRGENLARHDLMLSAWLVNTSDVLTGRISLPCKSRHKHLFCHYLKE